MPGKLKKQFKNTYRLAGYALALVILGVLGLTYNKAHHAMANHDLLKGIDQRSPAMVVDALKKGANANTIDPKIGAPPSTQGTVQSVIEALKGKPSQGNEWTALMRAARDGQSEAVKALLDHNAAPNTRNKDGSTALTLAAYYGHADVVKILLEHGADVNLADNLAITPLMSASAKGELNVVRLLLDKGAIINTTDNKGYTALLLAVDGGHTESVKLLLSRGAKTEARNKQGCSPLFQAAYKGYCAIAKALIESGADVNAATIDGDITPLWTAEMYRHPDMVALLKKAGAKEDK